MRGPLRTLPLLAVPLLLGGCLLPEQAGKPPDEVSFHFLSVFNVLLWLVRVAMVAVFARVVQVLLRDRPIPWPLVVTAALALLGAAYLTIYGAVTLAGYRIRCGEDELTVHVPLRVWRTVPWNEVHGLQVEGLHRTYGHGHAGSVLLPDGYTEWQELDLYLEGGSHHLDLGRFSPEQRGNLVENIEQRAALREWDLDQLLEDLTR